MFATIVIGAGAALAMTPATNAIVAVAPPRQAGRRVSGQRHRPRARRRVRRRRARQRVQHRLPRRHRRPPRRAARRVAAQAREAPAIAVQVAQGLRDGRRSSTRRASVHHRDALRGPRGHGLLLLGAVFVWFRGASRTEEVLEDDLDARRTRSSYPDPHQRAGEETSMSGEPEFGGVIGPDLRESSRGGHRSATARGAPNVVLSCSTTSGSRSSAATAPTSTPRTSTASPPTACASELPHHRALLADPVLPAHRPQPPLERHGPHRRPRRPATPATTAHPARQRLPLRDARASTATRPSPSASGTSRPRTRRTSRRAASSWPLGRGFERFYGFHGGETHQFVPTSPRTTTPSSRRARSPRATTSPRTSPTTRSSTSRPPRRRARQAVLPLLRHRCVPLAAPRAARVDRRATAGSSTTAGTRGATRPSRASRRRLIPPGTELSPRPRGSPRGTTCRADQKVAARFMECFAGFLSHTDAQIGARARLHRRARRARQHDHRARVGQRRVLRRRRARLDQRRAPLEP